MQCAFWLRIGSPDHSSVFLCLPILLSLPSPPSLSPAPQEGEFEMIDVDDRDGRTFLVTIAAFALEAEEEGTGFP